MFNVNVIFMYRILVHAKSRSLFNYLHYTAKHYQPNLGHTFLIKVCRKVLKFKKSHNPAFLCIW